MSDEPPERAVHYGCLDNETYTIDELAFVVDVNRRTIAELIGKGEIEATRESGNAKYSIARSAVIAWIRG